MSFPGDNCCPPPTFLSPSVPCETVTNLGSCCTDGSSTHVTGLPSQAECLHDTATYSGAVPDVSGDASFGLVTPSVEVYASNWDAPAGSCGVHFLYTMTCPPCGP